jgi:hypothetical protein
MRILNQCVFTRIRSDGSSGFNEEGEWIEGTFKRKPFRGSIQPLGEKSREVQHALPEGVILDDVRVVYTDEIDLRTGNDRTGLRADDVEFRGEIFEVFKVDQWFGVRQLSHYKAYIHLKKREVSL